MYTFTSLLAPDFVSPRKGAYRMLERVRPLDRYTVEFTLKEPFGSFPINLVIPIVPKGAGAGLRNAPIGTGPYRFVSHPNYCIVAAEILVLPLCFGLVWYGIVFSVLNALVLWIRIRAEQAALRQ